MTGDVVCVMVGQHKSYFFQVRVSGLISEQIWILFETATSFFTLKHCFNVDMQQIFIMLNGSF